MKSNGNAKVKVKTSIAQKKENFTGALFIAPYLIGYVIFQGLPFLIAVVLGFTNVRYISKLEDASFVGINNFIRMFTDVDTMKALGRTGLYSLMYVPLIMVCGFFIAYMVNKGIHCKNLVRSMFFLPYVSNMVAVAVVFKLLLGPDGPVVYILSALGSENPPYLLYGLNTALPTVVCIAVWKGIGLNFITYLAALQNVSADLLEAAQIDGASKWRQLWNISLPGISPVISIQFLLTVGRLLTVGYEKIILLYTGATYSTADVISTYVYRRGLIEANYSYGAAISIFQAVIALILVVGSNKAAQKIGSTSLW